MADYSGILFNKSPMQLRSIGARGGRAYARNQRLRRARLALMPAPSPMAATPRCTSARRTGESAVRRVINLRLKGPGLLWDEANAEGLLAHLRAELAGAAVGVVPAGHATSVVLPRSHQGMQVP